MFFKSRPRDAIVDENESKALVFNCMREFKLNKVTLLLVCVLLPALFAFGLRMLPYLPSRYSDYAISNDFAGVVLSVVMKFPLLGLFLMLSKRLIRLNVRNRLYILLFIFSLYVQLCTVILPIGRINWYMWISICFLFPALIASIPKRSIAIKLVLVFLLFSYGVVYSFRAYFEDRGDMSRRHIMFPYRNVFFELE